MRIVGGCGKLESWHNTDYFADSTIHREPPRIKMNWVVLELRVCLFWTRLYPFTPHNTRRQLSAPTKSAGLLQHHCLDSTSNNGNRSTDNDLQSQWYSRRLVAPSHTKRRYEPDRPSL